MARKNYSVNAVSIPPILPWIIRSSASHSSREVFVQFVQYCAIFQSRACWTFVLYYFRGSFIMFDVYFFFSILKSEFIYRRRHWFNVQFNFISTLFSCDVLLRCHILLMTLSSDLVTLATSFRYNVSLDGVTTIYRSWWWVANAESISKSLTQLKTWILLDTTSTMTWNAVSDLGITSETVSHMNDMLSEMSRIRYNNVLVMIKLHALFMLLIAYPWVP